MKRVAISRLSTLLKMWSFKYVGNSSVDEAMSSFVGPETFQAGLELYKVAGPAGLYLL